MGRTDEWSVQPVFHRELGSDATLPDLGQEHYYPEAVGAVLWLNGQRVLDNDEPHDYAGAASGALDKPGL